MAEDQSPPAGPDLALGVAAADFKNDMLLGHVGEEDVLLVRAGSEFFAIDAHCSHYHGPLADGLVVGASVRCPWHHACFDLRTGEAIRAPALSPLSVWMVEQESGGIFVRRKLDQPKAAKTAPADAPRRIVIVGGGAAGFAAAEMLRREGLWWPDHHAEQRYGGAGRPAEPVQGLSRRQCAGRLGAAAAGQFLCRDFAINLQLAANVTAIDVRAGQVVLADGKSVPYDRLLLATGAEPVRLPMPGADQPHVHTLRTLADCRAIIENAKSAKRAVVIGASFIGLEVAAALRARDIEVHVVAPEQRPMERILGPDMGDFVRALHEEHGVIFHLGDTVAAIDGKRATLKSGGTLEADLVVVGVGVRPRLTLAEQAGLAIDRGVTVNAYLETSARGIYAAGDIARWPDPHSRENIRVEHWVVAERQGQTAARNMLGRREVFDAVPFFWSQHYDVPINYVGHAEKWDEIAVDGDIKGRDCMLRYKKGGRVLAVTSIYRDVESLQAELAMERA